MTPCDLAGREGNTAKRRGNVLGSTSSGTSASAPGLPSLPTNTSSLHACTAFSSSSDRSTPNRSSRNDPEAGSSSVIWRDERGTRRRRGSGRRPSRSRVLGIPGPTLHVLLDLDILRTAHPLEGSLRARCGSVIWSGRGRAEGVAGSRSLTPGGPRVLADPARTARPAVGFALGRRERRVDAVEHARAGGAGDCVSACMPSGRRGCVCCRDACTGRDCQALRDVLVYTWCLCDVLRRRRSARHWGGRYGRDLNRKKAAARPASITLGSTLKKPNR